MVREKSTLIKMILGVICPTKGKFWYLGTILYVLRKKIRLKLGVFLGGKSNLIYHLPVLDSVRLFQSIYRVPKAVFAENLARYSQALQCDGFYSSGWRPCLWDSGCGRSCCAF